MGMAAGTCPSSLRQSSGRSGSAPRTLPEPWWRDVVCKMTVVCCRVIKTPRRRSRAEMWQWGRMVAPTLCLRGAGGCTRAGGVQHRALAMGTWGLVAPGLCPILGVPGLPLGACLGQTHCPCGHTVPSARSCSTGGADPSLAPVWPCRVQQHVDGGQVLPCSVPPTP